MAVLIIKIFAALILVMLIAMIVDNLRFVVREYKLRSDKIRYPVKIVFIADLHEKSYRKDNEKLVRKIRECEPDVILVGGDLIVSGQVFKAGERKEKNSDQDITPDAKWMKNSLSLMRRLTEICPVWFVQGNHELRMEYYEELTDFYKKFIEEMENAGVHFLHNGSVDPFKENRGGMSSGIVLQGLELPMKFYRKFRRTQLSPEELTALIGEADRKAYTVLLCHMPVFFPQYAKWGSDLCLCGHVHGGLMRLPFIGGVMGTRPNLFPRYSGGQYFYRAVTGNEEHISSMILTCGLGMHTLPIRIFNPGEVSVIELWPAKLRQEDKDGIKQDSSGH